MKLRTTLVLAAAAVASLAPAGAAEAASQKTAKFVAYVEGKQVTTWNVPRYNTYRDCQGQRWHEGSGTETVRFRTKPMKVLVYKNPMATVPMVKYGTWNMFKVTSNSYLDGTGKVERTGRSVFGLDPAECYDAGDPTVEDNGPYDCGTRRWDPSVSLHWTGNRVEIHVIQLVRDLDGSDRFENCPIETPMDAAEGEWTEISQRYPVRDVFDRSQGLVEVLGRKTWTEKVMRDHGTATTTTTFKLRLRRAR